MLDNYGVSKSNIGFILDATYTWIISLILLVCMCYRPQRGEPRSRQEADEIFGSRSSEESRIFKATVTVLLFFFNLLHWGMFVSFSQVSIFYSNAVHVQFIPNKKKFPRYLVEILPIFLKNLFTDIASIQDLGLNSYILRKSLCWCLHRY